VREQGREGRRAKGGSGPLGFAEPIHRPARVQSGRLTTRAGKRRRINALRRSFQHRPSNMPDRRPEKRRKSAIPLRLVAKLLEASQAHELRHPPPKLSPRTPPKEAHIGTGQAGTTIYAPYFIGFQ
jgi:hypothetical protein